MSGGAGAWPNRSWLVRHGQSAGNVARDAAETAGLHRIEISGRDVDVPLSDLGVEQAVALGQWFASGDAGGKPNVLLCSPCLRVEAMRTDVDTALVVVADR